MKPEYKMFALAAAVGPLLWIAEALVGAIVNGQVLTAHLWPTAGSHELSWRASICVAFVLIGLAALKVVRGRRIAEASARATDARLVTTLRSIADAVITIGVDRRITFMNQVAQTLTGWGDEALGRSMDEVFRIVNIKTREPVVNPVERVLREGVIVGVANDTVLIARDGSERQISDSAAPVRDADGSVDGVVLVFRDVTEAYEAEEAIRATEKRYRALFESLGEGFALHEIVCDAAGEPCDYRFLKVNAAFERFTGLRRQEILGKTVLEVLPGTERYWIDTFGRVALSGEEIRFEQYSAEIDKHLSVIAYRPAPGQFATLFVDITLRRRAEQRIRKLNAVLLAIREVNRLITKVTDRDELLDCICRSLVGGEGYRIATIALWDPAGKVAGAADENMDAAFEAMRGELGSGKRPGCWGDPGQAAEIRVVGSGDALCQGCPLNVEGLDYAAMCARLVYGGREFGVLTVGVEDEIISDIEQRELFEDVAGDIALALYTMESEQQRLQTADELVRSERLLHMVLDRSFDGVSFSGFDADTGGRQLMLCNKRFVEMSGRTLEELKGQANLDDMVTPVLCRPDAEQRPGLPCWGTSSWNRPDGKENYFEWTAAPVTLDGQEYIVGIDRDITARVQADRALRSERDKARHYMDVSKVIFLAVDIDGVVTLVNQMGCDTLGCREDQVLGVDWYQTFIAPDQRAEAGEQFRRILRGQEELGTTKEWTVLTASGGHRLIAWRNSLTYDDNGVLTGMLSSGQDITEQRRVEEQFRQAQKMEAIGRLAGGVAHDFNNQLTVVQGYCDLLLRQLPDPETTCKYVEEIRNASARASTMTGQLLVYSRKHVLRDEVVAVNPLLDEMADMLARMIGEDIRLRIEPGDQHPSVLADPVQLQQAIMNIAVNARDAMPDGGDLSIRTEVVDLTEQFARENIGASVGPHVMIEIRDTGVGISHETLNMLFEPFFTTKPTGQGTGLGLAMVYGFVKQSKGHVSVASGVGEGATFRIYLPAIDASDVGDDHQTDDLAEPEPEPEAPVGGATILVAEDEMSVREYLAQVLGRWGYAVTSAADADQAEAAAAAQGEALDLLITDVIMPGRTGVELARQLRRMRPDLKVLYVSGYAARPASPSGWPELDGPLLRKPFGPQELAAAVRDVLIEDDLAVGETDDRNDT